jgi:hypothetical protein
MKQKKQISIIKLLTICLLFLIIIIFFVLIENNKARENAFRAEASKVINAATEAVSKVNNENLVFSEENTSCRYNQLFCFTIEDLIKMGLYDGDEKQYSGKVLVNAVDPYNVSYNLYFKKNNEFKIVRGPHKDYSGKGVVNPEPWKEEYSICTCLEETD